MGVWNRIVAPLGALALSGVLVAAPATAAPPTAAADPVSRLTQAVTDAVGVDYSCSVDLGLLSLGSLPLHIDALQAETVPIGSTVRALTASTGLTALIGELTTLGLSVVFGTSSLVLEVGETLSAPGVLGANGQLTVGSFGLPADAEVGQELPITAPATLVLPIVSGLLGSLSCVLDDAGSDVLGTVLVGPAVTDTTIHTAEPPPHGGTSTSGGPSDPVLEARLVNRVVLAGRHARVRVRLVGGVPSGSVPSGGVVRVLCGGRSVGQARLSRRAATVRLALLRPGRHRLVVRADGIVRRLTLRVVG